MKIEYIYGNPPYEKDLHLKILNFCFKKADETVFLHPARWIQSLTSPKELRHFDGYIKEIQLVRENTKVLFCGMDISGDLVISTLKENTKKVNEINKFTMRSFDFDPVVMESVYNKVIKNINKSVKDVMHVDVLKDYAVVFSLIGGGGGADNAKMSKLVTSNQDCVYTNGIAEDPEKKKKKSKSWKSETAFNEDINGDIDPIQMDNTDTKFLFDNEDGVVFDLKKGNPN